MILNFWSLISKWLKSEFSIDGLRSGDRRQSLRIGFLTCFFVFGILGCGEKPKVSAGIIIANSKSYEASIYRQNCAICHGAEALGKTLNGKPVPSLRFGAIEKKSREEIYQQIKHGKLPMPAFENQLTETEINKMVDFILYSLQGREKQQIKNALE